MVKFIIPMTKNQTSKKDDFIFTMNRLKNSCRLPNVVADFSPTEKSPSQFEQIVPVFNNDKKYFTPSFILACDKRIYQNLPYEKSKFEERVRNSFQKNLQNPASLAQPSSNYCQICKTNFEDYMTHINNVEHQNSNRKSFANQMIIQLCKQYQISRKKTKMIKKDCNLKEKENENYSNRNLRSFRKKMINQQQNMKNFSFISTKINSSQANGL